MLTVVLLISYNRDNRARKALENLTKQTTKMDIEQLSSLMSILAGWTFVVCFASMLGFVAGFVTTIGVWSACLLTREASQAVFGFCPDWITGIAGTTVGRVKIATLVSGTIWTIFILATGVTSVTADVTVAPPM